MNFIEKLKDFADPLLYFEVHVTGNRHIIQFGLTWMFVFMIVYTYHFYEKSQQTNTYQMCKINHICLAMIKAKCIVICVMCDKGKCTKPLTLITFVSYESSRDLSVLQRRFCDKHNQPCNRFAVLYIDNYVGNISHTDRERKSTSLQLHHMLIVILFSTPYWGAI